MRIIPALTVAMLLSACGSVSRFSQMPTGHDLLFDATYQSIAVVDADSHQTRRTLPFGVPSPDWSHLYSTSGSALLDSDPSTGATLRTVALPATYQLASEGVSGVPGGLSQNGRWLALESWDASNSTPSATHLLVVDTNGAGAPTRVDLPGWWDIDAVSNDGKRLYLLEYVTGNEYRVRIFMLDSRTLDPQVVVDKTDPKEAMAGVRLTNVTSPDGQYQYTVYAREKEGAFIHALMLDGPEFAFCLDLPGSGYATNIGEFRWSLVQNPAGTRLYAVNAAIGSVVELDVGHDQVPTISRSVRIGASATASGWPAQNVEAKEFGANALAITPDGKTLVAAGRTGLLWIDTSTLKVRRNALTGWTVWTVGLSPDGERLYAIRDNGQIAQIDMATANVITTFSPVYGQPMALLRVASA